ncbi:hypothetical protein GI582_24970 [Sulfitobacter sp. BDSS02]|nr:hypothetical protein [Sulfitobacter sp. BDSS02]MBR9852654.1 hypothetical protein [Paracoccaceae bacterium]
MQWLFVSLLISCLVISVGEARSADTTFKDNDWNISFYSNCGFPVERGNNRSVKTVRMAGDRATWFTLRAGDVGTCSTDAKPRNNAPFWERAEIKQRGYIERGTLSSVSFSFLVLEGFRGTKEGFFQIHAHNDNCHAYPPVMMMFDRGQLVVRALRNVTQTGRETGSKGEHRTYPVRGYSLRSFMAAPVTINVSYDTRTSPGTLSVRINDKKVMTAPVEIAACGTPHVKLGIYRPDRGSGTSTAVFDDVNLTSTR